MTFYRQEICFVPWQRTPEDDGYEPALPEGIHYELLAQFGFGSGPGRPFDSLCLVRWPEDELEPPGLGVVPDDLKRLVTSGMAYPPALAIARDVRFQKEERNWSQAEAVEKFAVALRAELDHQRDRRFFLAKALAGDSPDFYKSAGEYYWILNYDPAEKEAISWVSDDYFVYRARVTEFDVDISWLEERFAAKSPSVMKIER